MPRLLVIDRADGEFPLEHASGPTLMEVIRDVGITDQFALCGGNCSCATCHVYIDDDHVARLPVMSPDEDDLLASSDHRRSNSRLSCQVQFDQTLDGARITIAPED